MRALQICSVLVRHGMSEMMSHTFIGRRRIRKRRQAQKDVISTASRMRMTIEELGPTYIKFGQILADRPDVISERFRVELKKLQSTAVPFSDETAIAIIEEQMHDTIENVFEQFDRHCLASASIGQVYQATLKGGKRVIVKVQRPHIDKKIKLDLYLMRHIARSFAMHYPEFAALNIIGLVDEFAENIISELDYNNEASNILQFRQMFKDSQTVYIPEVYMDYTTKRLLVMEHIDGISPDDIFALRAASLDTNQIAINGANALLTMILEYGYFHADPHAGNIFIMTGNRVCFIDFGMTGSLKPRDMNFLANFALGFAKKDSKVIANSLIELCGIRFFDRHEELEFDIYKIVRQNMSLDFEKVDFARVMQQCINVVVKYHLVIPSSIYMLLKALATIQEVAMKLDPQISLAPILLPYAKKIVSRKFSPIKLAGELFDTLTDYVNLFKVLPNEVNEILYKIKEGKIKHEIQLQNSELFMRSGRRIAKYVIYAILLSAMFIGSILLITWNPEMLMAKFMLGLSTIIIIYQLITLLFSKRK